MTDELLSGNQPPSQPPLTRKQKLLVALFWGIVGTAIYLERYVHPFLAIILLAGMGFLLLERPYKKGQPLPVLPRRFTAWISTTRFYEIFIQGAKDKQARQATIVLYYLAWICLYGAYYLSRDLTPAPDLEQLNVTHGVVEKIYDVPNSLRHQYCAKQVLYLLNEKGEEMNFATILTLEQKGYLQSIKGQEVVVWNKTDQGSPPCYGEEYVYQIQHKGKTVKVYNRKRYEAVDRGFGNFVKILVVIGLLSLFGVWGVNRRVDTQVSRKQKGE